MSQLSSKTGLLLFYKLFSNNKPVCCESTNNKMVFARFRLYIDELAALSLPIDGGRNPRPQKECSTESDPPRELKTVPNASTYIRVASHFLQNMRHNRFCGSYVRHKSLFTLFAYHIDKSRISRLNRLVSCGFNETYPPLESTSAHRSGCERNPGAFFVVTLRSGERDSPRTLGLKAGEVKPRERGTPNQLSTL